MAPHIQNQRCSPKSPSGLSTSSIDWRWGDLGKVFDTPYLSNFFHCKQSFFKVIRTEIYNTDQGSQYTSEAFTELLKSKKDQGQHGCERQGLRQCFCRAALEDRETKRSLSERILKYPRMPWRIECLL